VKLLVIGGTVFLGRHLVDAALQAGHEVTLFTRGEHNPDLFPEAEKLRGNRDGNLTALVGRRWDAAIDTCGYFPRVVRESAELLADAVDHYTFVSTISVYTDISRRGITEDAPVGMLDDQSVEEITGKTYGPLKALCERVVLDTFPGRSFVPRPGLIVGPFDPSDRFTYWSHRLAQGGKVLAPGHPNRDVQLIDARDLAAWMLRMSEARGAGVYNATGPTRPLTMGRVLWECKAQSGSKAELVWVDESFLLERQVQPWMELPLWVPDTAEYAGFSAFDCRRAINTGLTFRPLADTVADTLTWDATRPPDMERAAGMAADKERELLEAWAANSPARGGV